MNMKKSVVLIIHDDPHEAITTRENLAGRLDRHKFEICGRAVSHGKTISDCRNLEPIAVLIKREVVLKKEFGNLTKKIKEACPNTKIFVFDDERNLKQIVSGKFFKKFFKEVKNVTDFRGSRISSFALSRPTPHT